MTQEQLKHVGYIVCDGEIEATTYRDYLLDYGIDWCTSPRGNTDRAHIREEEIETELDNGDIEIECEYQIWDWGVNGNNPYYTGTSFDNEEDAELYLFELREGYIMNHNWDAPQFFNTYDEAVAELAVQLRKPYEVVDRFLRIKEITNRRKAEEARIRQIEEERKRIELERKRIELEKLVHEEADQLIPDQQFIEDVAIGYSLPKEERSKALSAAFVYFLQRTGYGRIKSDFWKVFRIVSKKQLV